MNERLVLLRSEIVLRQLPALNFPADKFRPCRPGDKSSRANPAIAQPIRDGDARFAIRIARVPFIQGSSVAGRVSAHICDLDTDGTRVRSRGVPRAFLHVERLVNCAIEVEHKMHAQVAHVVQDAKTLAAGPGHVEMDYELIDHLLTHGKDPASA